jgi:hypothetical protein
MSASTTIRASTSIEHLFDAVRFSAEQSRARVVDLNVKGCRSCEKGL